MSIYKKLSMAAASGEVLNVEDVFSTTLYAGDGTNNRSITTNIDTDTEGGLVWIKNRSEAFDHELVDSERGDKQVLRSNSSGAEYNDNNAAVLTSTGFTISGGAGVNKNGNDHVAWTFRKAPKFFDVVTYTGNGTAGRTISHNLGSVPGCIMVKRYDVSADWVVYHVGAQTPPEDYYQSLNNNIVASDAAFWNDTAPTATEFTLGSLGAVNNNGDSYVAYLFANNNGDGNFGPTGDQDIIKCGSYTGNGSSTGPQINLGFEPQWLLIKGTTYGNENWMIFDTTRGIPAGAGYADKYLRPNLSNAEGSVSYIDLEATGFKITNDGQQINLSGQTYTYIAIRHAPMVVTDATDVFAVDGNGSDQNPAFRGGFPVDMGMYRDVSTTVQMQLSARLMPGKRLRTDTSDNESSSGFFEFDYQNGWGTGAESSNVYSWMWRCAPSFFDVVVYKGDGTSSNTLNHSLGVAPEMIWVKNRSVSGRDWTVYHSALGAGYKLYLNTTGASAADNSAFANTTPTASSFFVGGTGWTNGTNDNMIAFLFASVPGVSKVGSYTGTGGTDQTIDCGFSAGARFILIKRTDTTGDWYVFDSERGYGTGQTDPYILLNSNAAQSSYNMLSNDSSGFIVKGTDINNNGGSYIFYAIA